MASKQLTINFTNEQVASLNSSGYRLCFTAGVNNDYNVIGWCDTLAGHVRIAWEERYQLAASMDSFMNGAKFNAATESTDIKSGEVYTLPGDWTDGGISSDSSLPAGSFKFNNGTDRDVSAVVYLRIKGRPTPIYVGDVGGKGSAVLTPNRKVLLWVQRNAETGTMGVDRGRATEFDLSNTSSLELSYDGNRFVQK